MIRRPPRSTRTDTLFPTRRSSDLTDGSAGGTVLGSPVPGQSSGGVPVDVYGLATAPFPGTAAPAMGLVLVKRSEEHTSELQSLMRISYAVFCLKKKKITNNAITHPNPLLNRSHYTTNTNTY